MSNKISHCSTFSLHDWPVIGVKEVLKLQDLRGWRLPVKLKAMCKTDKPERWAKPDEILGRKLRGPCYGCRKTSSGFENSHFGEIIGYRACSNNKDLVKGAVTGWLNSPGHRKVMLSEGLWRKHKWTRLGAGIITRCDNNGAPDERFRYWANSWFSGLPH